MRFPSASLAVLAGGVLAMAGAASGSVIVTFGYTDLNGSFDGTTFSAVAADSGTLQSSGDVTRLAAPGGTAQFEPGFVSLGDLSDFAVAINLTNLVCNTADGAGTFTATDVDGDTVSGSIDGTWITPGFGIVFFNGLLDSVVFTNTSGDGTFDSPDGGFNMGDLLGSYDGAIVQLFTNVGGGFFNANFSEVSTQVSGDLIPSPGAAALFGLGAAFGLIRPRRERSR
jgi:hypothetical protein